MRDYIDSLGAAVAALPPECKRALEDPDLQGAAVTLLHCELAWRGDPATGQLLQEIARTFAAAATRLGRFDMEPMTPRAAA